MADLRRYRAPLIILGIVAALIALDLVVGRVQSRAVEEKDAHRKANERLAYYLERTTVEDISYTGKGNIYEMRLRYENVRPDEEMWIMVYAVKAFVQVGTLWRELSVNDGRMKRGDYSAERLKEPYTMTVTFDMSIKNFQELMQGYMHMKIGSLSYISAEAVTKEDLIDKYEDVFLYLSTEKKKGQVKTLLH
ncbi:MAG TPA: hypothetical protein VLG39_11430 [Nitrospirota bacterium]|nr:hypothetical protein [Nitrospirota bacterium]